MKRKPTGSHGFTLIEIMLVVIIIGILAAFMVPRFAGKQEKAKITKAMTEIASLTTALDGYEMDIGKYPTTEDGLMALMERPASLTPEATWDGPYLRELLMDPWGHEYQYRFPGENSVDYDLWSFGPDGQEGGEDDIFNVSENRGGYGQTTAQ